MSKLFSYNSYLVVFQYGGKFFVPCFISTNNVRFKAYVHMMASPLSAMNVLSARTSKMSVEMNYIRYVIRAVQVASGDEVKVGCFTIQSQSGGRDERNVFFVVEEMHYCLSPS